MNTTDKKTAVKLNWMPSDAPCYPYPKGFDAKLTDKHFYRVVHYNYRLVHGLPAVPGKHWSSYVYPGGRYVEGTSENPIEYKTREAAQRACQNAFNKE